MSTILSSSSSTISNRLTIIANDNADEEDQLNRINLQALQNRDPYITKIIDQAQRVCVYKFLADKREWERKDLEGTLFVYERTCEPYHGFVILSTVSRETFVQVIKASMEFKHSPNYEAFLQYKVDVGDIYGIWFISKTDCPRVTECLKRLTIKAKEVEQPNDNSSFSISSGSSDIFSLLNNAKEKFQETKRKQDSVVIDPATSMPAALLRLFSTQDAPASGTNNDEREQELKKTLGIVGKPALSVTELEKKLFHPPSSTIETTKSIVNTHSPDNIVKPVPILNKAAVPVQPHRISPTTTDWTLSTQKLNNGFDAHSNTHGRLMTPSEFQTIHPIQSPVLIAPSQIAISPPSYCHCQHSSNSSTDRFSKDALRKLLVDMLQNDEEFLTGLHNAYVEKQNSLHRIFS
ncbi:unnamed protein product [Adineta ricciae]|uniref:Uncharacterized protein n=1 Tax=Adineta ricciae TaxID=249248 RepID=A0A815ETW8_ADIRI|nr:unnamed protein product [Adineta ricciae]CAF1337701.1 unnamed protein product [Adineta ricciae]